LAEEVGRVVERAKLVVADVREAMSQPRRSVRAYVVVSRRIDRTAVDEIEALRRVAVGKPVILVTSADPEHLRLLCHVRLAGIVWWKDSVRELPRVLESVNGRSLALEFAVSVRQEPRAEDFPHLADAIEMICRAGPPPPPIPRLAAEACVSERTLRRHVRALFGDDWTPSALLEGIGVLMAVDLVQQGWRSPDLPDQFGVSDRTLRSWAKRRYGSRLRELCERPELALERVRFDIEGGDGLDLADIGS
jgi:hypothetical protein